MWLLKLFLKAARFALFSVLMFVRPFVGAVFKAVALVCLFCFTFCLFAARDQHTALWAFLIGGIAATAVRFGFDFLLALLAPGDFLLIEQ